MEEKIWETEDSFNKNLWSSVQFLDLSQFSNPELTNRRGGWVPRRKNSAIPQVYTVVTPFFCSADGPLAICLVNCALQKGAHKYFKDYWPQSLSWHRYLETQGGIIMATFESGNIWGPGNKWNPSQEPDHWRTTECKNSVVITCLQVYDWYNHFFVSFASEIKAVTMGKPLKLNHHHQYHHPWPRLYVYHHMGAGMEISTTP